MTAVKEIFAAILLSIVIVAVVIIVIGIGMARGATTVCLTKKEARQLWPRQHTYWYSRNRCWSNRRGPPRNLRMDPVVNSLAKDTAPKDKVPVDTCCWPDLDRDANGVIVEPPRQFWDRWNDQPWIGKVR